MPIYVKKIIIGIFTSLFLFSYSLLIPITSLAQNQQPATWYSQDFKSWLEKVNDPDNPSEIFGERYTSAQVEWVIYGFFNFLFSKIAGPEVIGACIKADPVACAKSIDNLVELISSGDSIPMANSETSLLSLVFANRSLSGIGYVKEKINKFSLVPTAQAQTIGFGFDALRPIQEMWKASRNVAYGLSVLAAIILAFMIMFRVKISPQVVISVQSAIPKLIIALILITFSYAIAGFLVDLMYVVIGILSVMLASFAPTVLGYDFTPERFFALLTNGSLLGVPGIGIFLFIFTYLFPLILVVALVTIGLSLIPVLNVAAIISLIILFLIILIGLVIWVKTLFALIKAFAGVILSTIFAPLQIIAGVVIPSFGFGQWVKSYLGSLSVFVVTGLLMALSIIFLLQGVMTMVVGSTMLAGLAGAILRPLLGQTNIAPPEIRLLSGWPPLLGDGGPIGVGLLFLGVSFILFTLIPKATEIIQGLISGRPFAYGSAIGEAVNVFGIGTFAGKTAQDAIAKGLYYRDAQGRSSGLIPDLLGRGRNAPRGRPPTGPGTAGGGPTP